MLERTEDRGRLSSPWRWGLALAFLFFALSSASLWAATPIATQLVSAHNPLVPRPAAGNGDSAAHTITPDGRYLLFLSTANNLTPGGNNQFCPELFLRDCLSNTTTLVTLNTSGVGAGNTNIVGGMISTNGRYVVFASDAPDLVIGDTNKTTDVFLRDLVAGSTTLISVATNGGPGNASSTSPWMTPDGRYVAFVSGATNLAANTTNGIPNVFVRDTVAGLTTLLTANASGNTLPGYTVMGPLVMTPDGQYVAFFSTASNLPFAGFSNANGDIYLCDVATTNIAWVSSNAAALAGFTGGASTHAVLSDDGRYVAFKYGSTNGVNVAGTNQGAGYVFQYDALAGTTTVISSNSFPPQAFFEDRGGPVMTPNGQFVAFVEQTVIGNVPYASVHLWNQQGAPDTLVSQDQFGNWPSNTWSDSPVITSDGTQVAFMSMATTLVTNPVVGGYHAYLRNIQTATTQLLDLDTNGAGSVDLSGTAVCLSSNAQFAGFSSLDGSLVAGDFNKARDVFLRDTVNQTNALISVRNPLVNDPSADGPSSVDLSFYIPTQSRVPPAYLTPTGRYVVYSSWADDLVTNHFNGTRSVFETDLWTGSNYLVSVGLDGNAAQGGDSYRPVASADGRYVAFVSAATNLVAGGPTNRIFNLFLRDMQLGVTTMQDVDSNGNLLGNGPCSAPTMSQDGRYLIFVCQTNVSSLYTTAFWRDTQGNFTQVLPTLQPQDTQTGAAFSISQNGRYVTYSPIGSAQELAIWDSTVRSNVYTNTSTVPMSSPSGTKMLGLFGSPSFPAVATNWITKTNLSELLNANVQYTGPYFWSADESSIAVMSEQSPSGTTSSVNQLPTGTSTADYVYLWNLNPGTVAVVSSNYATGGAPNGTSDTVAISGNGRLLVYRSYASNIAPGISSVPNIILYDGGVGSNDYLSYAGSNMLLAPDAVGQSWNPYVSAPAISGDGSVAVFESTRGGLVAATPVLTHVANIYATTIAPWGTTDSVGDGIPDEWRAYYFGGNGTTTNSQSCASCDADGSGMSNLQDYLAGINPTNAASVLAVQVTPGNSSNSFLLQWTAALGISYAVQYSPSLSNPVWTPVPGDVVIVGTRASFTVTMNPSGGFYRVVVAN